MVELREMVGERNVSHLERGVRIGRRANAVGVDAGCNERLEQQRVIHVTDGDQPYMDKWWVPGLSIGYDSSFVHQFADFLTGLDNDEPAMPTFSDALATDLVTDAVLKSAQTGQWESAKA